MSGWLLKVATNLALNYLRSEKSRRERETAGNFAIIRETRSPEEIAAESQEMQLIKNILNQLPTRDRTCLLLKFAGFNYTEIAEMIGVRKTSVGTILARSREKFKQAYLRKGGKLEDVL